MSNKTLHDIVAQTILKTNTCYDEACAYLDQRLQQISSTPSLLNNLGLLFYRKVEYDLACRCFYFLLAHHEKQHTCHNNLGLTLNRFGLGEKAVEHYQKALNIKADYHPARANLAYALHYFGQTGRTEIKQAHQDIAQYVFAEPVDYLDQKVRTRTGKINLGYVSSDLREHAVGRFMIGILEHHDRSKFNIHIFDNRANNNDATAQRLKALPLQWHNINGLNTEEACTLITNQDIDVLIDLSGHTNGGRPDIFSNRVAPSQMTYLGYPNTSGLPMMNFRIGDHVADPLECASQNTETMLRLKTPMWNYTPWQDMPEPGESPFQENGYVTFGSANNHAKLQIEWLDVWAKALAVLPQSRFKIKSRALRNPKMAGELLAFFKQRGVDPERITIEHYSPTRAGHWQTLRSFDIGLDSFPYNGTTTSCDLLWLGVPIITRQGNSHVSRTTASLLNGLGLDHWVANNDSDFIRLCEEKAHNLNELSKCRQSLRTRIENSSIGHSPLFMVDYENLIHQAFEKTES